MALIYLLYCLSGFIGLIYEIVWYRYFVDRFGAGNITFVLVLCSFIGGLGVGAALSRMVTKFLRPLFGNRDALTFYGQTEMVIAVTALGLFFLSSWPNYVVGDFPYTLKGDVYEPILGYQVCKALAVILCVFVPCFFMGITFPLLCATFQSHGDFPSRLYAWNTLGACAGVLVAEFVLLRYLGTTVAFCVALLLNVILGAVFLKWGESFSGRLLVGGPAANGRKPKEEAREATVPASPMPVQTALACAILSGLVSGALEADMMKRYSLWGEHLKVSFSFLVFWVIFAIFLASACIRTYRVWRFSLIQGLFLMALAYHLMAAHFHVPMRQWINRFVLTHISHDFYNVGVAEAFFMGLYAVFPTFFCTSLLLPHVCNSCQEQKRHLGLVYGVNTLAFCGGVLLFGWILPRVNPFYSIRAFLGVFAICGAYLALVRETRPPRLAFAVAGLAAVSLVLCFSPRGFDRSFLRGRYSEKLEIGPMRSDGSHVVYVVYKKGRKSLFFDCHSMSGTSKSALRYMKLMAHFPLLAHPHPKNALLICFGVGNTAKAICSHSSIERLDAVDLSGPVFELAPEFAATNDKVYEDKRVRLIHDDGRTFLDLTRNKYDLITSEPPPPSMPGVSRLYSIEYYQACRAHLTPDGIVSQWLPVYQLTADMIDRMVETFRVVFPETLMFCGAGQEIIMLGSQKPIDLARVEQRFAQDGAVLADLKSIGVPSPAHMLARIYQVKETIDERFRGSGIITDDKNFLDYCVTTCFNWYQLIEGKKELTGPYRVRKATLDYRPLPVVKELKKQHVQCYAELLEILKLPASLTQFVRDFPIKVKGGAEAISDPSLEEEDEGPEH